MEEELKVKQMEPLILEWNKYIDYLIEAIDESNFVKRGEIKPMATPKGDLEAHLTSRTTHQRNAANIAKRIAKGLGLNELYIYVGMLMHDAGHPFSAHDGEEIFTTIGEIFNVQYFHHNAKGVEVIRSENICQKAISKIPNIENMPELRKKLEEEFDYFLDIVISHDGEATATEMYKKEEDYSDIQTAVQTKLTLACAENKYKCIAQTNEGKIAKFADVIAYLATDIRDGFRLGIYKDFPDEYLELFGEMFANDYTETSEEKIKIAKNIINQIKDEKLRELVQDAKEIENKEIIEIANKAVSEISSTNTDLESEEVNEIVEKYIIEFIKLKSKEQMTDEEKNFLDSDIQKIREFIGKKLRVRSSVVTEVTSRMQEFFINDLLKNSRGSDKLQFSALGNRLFFKAKAINYATFVPKTKWEYQKNAQPKAAFGLVKLCAQSLTNSGAIANKFYDRAMRKYITDKEALKYLTASHRNSEEYKKYKTEYEIRDIKPSSRRYTTTCNSNKQKAEKELFANLYEYVQNEGSTFAVRYLNTFKAIETQIREKVKKALDNSYIIDLNKETKDAKDFFESKMNVDIQKIRNIFQTTFEGKQELTQEEIELMTQKLIIEERQKMEEKMAIQLSIDYLSGMSDRAFNELAIRTGHMTQEDLNTERVDGSTALEKNTQIQKLLKGAKELEEK